MTRDELLKMVNVSNIKKKDIVIDAGKTVRRYTAIIEGLRVNHECDGTPCRPYLSVYQFIDFIKSEYIKQLVGGLI